MLSVILAHSQIAASPVTSDLSCQDEIRKGHVAAVMTEIEDVEEERGDEEEEEKLTEGDGNYKYVFTKIMVNLAPLFFKWRIIPWR